MRGEWQECEVRLDYTLGGIRLWTVRLRGLRCTTHFTELGTDLERTAPQMEALPPGVDVAVIEGHPVEGPLPRLRARGEALVYAPSQYRRSYIELTGTFEDYLRTLRSDARYKFRRRAAQFAAMSGGKLDLREYRRPEEVAEFYGLAREISKKTYQERQLDAGLPQGEVYRAELLALAGRRAVRGYLLFHGGRPVAYALARVEKQTLSYDKVGYDPAYRNHFPGIVLLWELYRRLFAERELRRFDFGAGEYRYKQRLAPGSMPCADVYYYRRTARWWCLLAAHSLVDAVSHTAGRLAERWDLKEKLQRWIRTNLRPAVEAEGA